LRSSCGVGLLPGGAQRPAEVLEHEARAEPSASLAEGGLTGGAQLLDEREGGLRSGGDILEAEHRASFLRAGQEAGAGDVAGEVDEGAAPFAPG